MIMADGERRRVRLFGQPHSAEAYALRDYLQRSVVAFDWFELASDNDCQLRLRLPKLKNVRLPVVELPDGKRLFTEGRAALRAHHTPGF